MENFATSMRTCLMAFCAAALAAGCAIESATNPDDVSSSIAAPSAGVTSASGAAGAPDQAELPATTNADEEAIASTQQDLKQWSECGFTDDDRQYCCRYVQIIWDIKVSCKYW